MNGTLSSNVSTTLLKASAWLAEHELYQGYYGRGLRVDDAPRPPKTKWPEPHAIDVWPADAVHRLDACDVMGAIMWAAGGVDPGAEVVQYALRRLHDALLSYGVTQTPCAWSDTPGRTKYEVAQLLGQAATFEDCTHDSGNCGFVDDAEPGWWVCTGCGARRPVED